MVETANIISGCMPINTYMRAPTASQYRTFFIWAMSARDEGHWQYISLPLNSLSNPEEFPINYQELKFGSGIPGKFLINS